MTDILLGICAILIGFVIGALCTLFYLLNMCRKFDRWLALLEKQSKENMIEALRLEYEKGKADGLQEQRKEWTAEDLLNRNEIADILQEYNRDDLIDWLEKQGNDSYLQEKIENFTNAHKGEDPEGIIAACRGGEEQGEQKLSNLESIGEDWSKEDKVKINRIVGFIENLDIPDNDILRKDAAWLKSLKERLKGE